MPNLKTPPDKKEENQTSVPVEEKSSS